MSYKATKLYCAICSFYLSWKDIVSLFVVQPLPLSPALGGPHGLQYRLPLSCTISHSLLKLISSELSKRSHQEWTWLIMLGSKLKNYLFVSIQYSNHSKRNWTEILIYLCLWDNLWSVCCNLWHHGSVATIGWCWCSVVQ